jgi:excisionase family DNA binding protein
MVQERFLGLAEFCERLGVSKSTAERLIRRGVLPFYRIGRQIRLSEQTIEDYLSSTKNVPAVRRKAP